MHNIFFFLAILIVLVLLYKYLIKEGFVNQLNTNNNIIFLSTEQTQDFFNKDPDFYMANLSPTDLYARKVKLAADYKFKACEAAACFSDEQKQRITTAAKKADEFFSKVQVQGIDCLKIAEIPWIFAYTKGNMYENGLPHTRGDIIFLSSNINETQKDLIRLLIHEKVHIYERLYPEEIDSYLEHHGYIKWKQRLGVPRIRANPDLNNWIYIDPNTQKPMMALYTSDKPTNISDTTLTNVSFEHPYELLAYNMEKQLNNI